MFLSEKWTWLLILTPIYLFCQHILGIQTGKPTRRTDGRTQPMKNPSYCSNLWPADLIPSSRVDKKYLVDVSRISRCCLGNKTEKVFSKTFTYLVRLFFSEKIFYHHVLREVYLTSISRVWMGRWCGLDRFSAKISTAWPFLISILYVKLYAFWTFGIVRQFFFMIFELTLFGNA